MAAVLLARRGYQVVEANFTCRRGEIDLVARHGDTLCFVEVKARASRAYGGAVSAVSPQQRRRVAAAAEVYLSRHPHAGPCRFDVVALEVEHGEWSMEVFENAFEAGI